MGFGFLSMTARAGVALDPPVDVFVHQVRLVLVTLLGKKGDWEFGCRALPDGLSGWDGGDKGASLCAPLSSPRHPDLEFRVTTAQRGGGTADYRHPLPAPFREPLRLTTCLLPLSPGKGAGGREVTPCGRN